MRLIDGRSGECEPGACLASASASAARSAASAWRRLSRARVSRARAATWLTPSAAASSTPGQVVELGEQEGGPLALGDPRQGALHVARQVGVHDQVLGGGRRPVRLAGPREEADDLAPADLVEGHAVGDLVEPGAGVLRLLERLVVLVGLDEGVLGQVRGELGLAEHAQEVGVDLAVVLGEQGLDEDPGFLVIPHAAHGADPGSERGAARMVREDQRERGRRPQVLRAGWITKRGHWAARARRPKDDGLPPV